MPKRLHSIVISIRRRDIMIICKNKISRSRRNNVKRLCETIWNDSSGNCKLRLNYVHGIIEAFILFDNPYVPLFPLQKVQRNVAFVCFVPWPLIKNRSTTETPVIPGENFIVRFYLSARMINYTRVEIALRRNCIFWFCEIDEGGKVKKRQ